MISGKATLPRQRRVRLFLVLLSIGIAIWLNLPFAQSNERLPGQANRIGDLWKLNAARQPCPAANTLPPNACIPPQQREGSQAIPVGVNIHVNEIPFISDTHNQFQVDGLLTSTWCDSRVISETPRAKTSWFSSIALLRIGLANIGLRNWNSPTVSAKPSIRRKRSR